VSTTLDASLIKSTAACVPNFITYSFDFSAVPKNHRLVVQHVFGVLVFVADARGAQVTLEDGANQAVSAFLAPPSFLRENLFDQPALQYFDAESAPLLLATAAPVSWRPTLTP
jgi:hypothetical protein